MKVNLLDIACDIVRKGRPSVLDHSVESWLRGLSLAPHLSLATALNLVVRHGNKIWSTAEGQRAVGRERGATGAKSGFAFDDVDDLESSAWLFPAIPFAEFLLGIADENLVRAAVASEFLRDSLAHDEGFGR